MESRLSEEAFPLGTEAMVVARAIMALRLAPLGVDWSAELRLVGESSLRRRGSDMVVPALRVGLLELRRGAMTSSWCSGGGFGDLDACMVEDDTSGESESVSSPGYSTHPLRRTEHARVFQPRRTRL